MVTEIFLPWRELGRTGFRVTRLGIGDVADRNVPIEQCVATVRRAMEAGLNLVDTAPGYEEGYSEEVVGRALEGRRAGMFVIDKIDHHEEPVAGQVEGSLKRLGMEMVDLFVFHGLSTMEGWGRVTGPGGGMEQLGRCVKAGKARFRGISCHHPDVLAAAIPSGLCDVVMFAVGAYVDERYVREILPLAKKHGVGVVAFKTFGAGKLLGDTEGYSRPLSKRPRGKISSGGAERNSSVLPRLTVEECLHYTLSCDVDVALLGMSFANEQEAAFAAAPSFKGKLTEPQMEDIRRRAVEAVKGKGACWWNPRPLENAD